MTGTSAGMDYKTIGGYVSELSYDTSDNVSIVSGVLVDPNRQKTMNSFASPMTQVEQWRFQLDAKDQTQRVWDTLRKKLESHEMVVVTYHERRVSGLSSLYYVVDAK